MQRETEWKFRGDPAAKQHYLEMAVVPPGAEGPGESGGHPYGQELKVQRRERLVTVAQRRERRRRRRFLHLLARRQLQNPAPSQIATHRSMNRRASPPWTAISQLTDQRDGLQWSNTRTHSSTTEEHEIMEQQRRLRI
jgi:hypothetical protein